MTEEELIKRDWLNPVAVCKRCGREFLTLGAQRPYRDGYGYKKTGEECGGELELTEKGRAVEAAREAATASLPHDHNA